ncbi:dienelactone hydrolase family protein [Sphingobium amiense]|uniref:Dienelactone hydrolase family protein n=2 Tax=Sphingobium amiense TaxID=135719 RepID=A0A494WAI7_9SPHN|nr:dienelactone hydrolase family protein [Sphingobium amiense]
MTIMKTDTDVQSVDGQFSAYVALPDRSNGLAVIVFQEIFGVNANIRQIVDDFAVAGYAAAAPDLYWRQQPGIQLDPGSEAERAQAMELMAGLNRDEAVQDGAATLNMLRDRLPGLKRSAAVGYCFGGGVAYLMAARGLVDAGISYYGTGLQQLLPEMIHSQGRLLLHIAADDHLCPPEAQHLIAEAAHVAGSRASVSIHDGVGHAFARVGGATYNREAADRANAETFALLEALASLD